MSERTHEMKYDLLEEPLLRWEAGDGQIRRGSLPELLAAFARDEVEGHPAVRPHQRHAWHAFTVQLAALALGPGESPPPKEAAAWKEALLRLAENQRSAWCLVVPDRGLPAFMQPPYPGKQKATRSFLHPDEVDLLVTARNHDVKRALIEGRELEAWVYALVSVQTMGGYEGKSVYGIARMNGGYATRVGASLNRSLRPSRRFLDDLALLRSHEREWAEAYQLDRAGHRLLWLLPWDGSEAIPVESCHPWFVELCRILRLSEVAGGALVCHRWGTQTSRVAAEERRGVLGDPWLPLSQEDGSWRAISLGERGFDYRLTHRLLSADPEFRLPLCALPEKRPREELLLLLEGLARTQGKTRGYHQRLLVVPKRVRGWLTKPDERERLAKAGKERIAMADTYWTKVLRPALRNLDETASPSPWKQAFEQEVDGVFFEDLFQHALSEEHSFAWLDRLDRIGWALFELAERTLPLYSARRYHLRANARRAYFGALKRTFPDWWSRRNGRAGDSAVWPEAADGDVNPISEEDRA